MKIHEKIVAQNSRFLNRSEFFVFLVIAIHKNVDHILNMAPYINKTYYKSTHTRITKISKNYNPTVFTCKTNSFLRSCDSKMIEWYSSKNNYALLQLLVIKIFVKRTKVVCLLKLSKDITLNIILLFLRYSRSRPIPVSFLIILLPTCIISGWLLIFFALPHDEHVCP